MVNGVFLRLYLKLRKDEVEKAKAKLNIMNIDTIFQCLTKDCWVYGVQYDVVIKTQDYFIIKLFGRRKDVLIKYHKTDVVFSEDYDRFLYEVNLNESQRGVYITTGVFDFKISKFFNNKIIIEDNAHFIKYQLGFYATTKEVFYRRKIKFFKYLEY